MEKEIEFSPKLDIQKCECVSFALKTLNGGIPNIKISVEYGLSLDASEIFANVWAGFEDDSTRHFLYTAHISPAEVCLENYTGIAVMIHNSTVFCEKLTDFLNGTGRF